MFINTLFRRTRRNHALEHATISVLSRSHPHGRVLGISGPRGFTLYTDLTAQEIVPAANQALHLLKTGYSALAVHPNCGTNLLTSATLTTVVTLLGRHNWPQESWGARFERLLQLISLNALALVLARPLGMWIQAHLTVDPAVQDVEITSVLMDRQGGQRRFRIHTRQG